MQRKLETVFRATLVALALILIWSVWASAQPATNAPTPAAAGSPLPFVSHDHLQWLTFRLDRVEWLKPEVLSIPLWQYLASLIYIVLAYFASKLADWLIRRVLKRWTAKTRTQFDDLLLELLRGPLRVIVFVILLHAGLRVFDWPGWLEAYLAKGLTLVVAGSLTYVAFKLADLALDFWRDRTAREADPLFDAQLFPIIRKSFKAFIAVVALLVTAQHLDFKITGLLASLSIGGLALGLAAQDTVANLFGAVSIFVDKPFRIGDRIRIGTDVDGTVESIGLRSTRVRNLDGHLITVPNKTMGNANIINIAARPNIKTEMNLGLTYDTSADTVQEAVRILNDIYRAHPMTENVWVNFTKFADSALNIQVVHWWKGTEPEAHLAAMHDMNLEVKRRFDAAKIHFAFPSRTVYLRQESPA